MTAIDSRLELKQKMMSASFIDATISGLYSADCGVLHQAWHKVPVGVGG